MFDEDDGLRIDARMVLLSFGGLAVLAVVGEVFDVSAGRRRARDGQPCIPARKGYERA